MDVDSSVSGRKMEVLFGSEQPYIMVELAEIVAAEKSNCIVKVHQCTPPRYHATLMPHLDLLSAYTATV